MTSARALADEVMDDKFGALVPWRAIDVWTAHRDRIEAAILAAIVAERERLFELFPPHEAEGWRPISEAKKGDVILIGWTSGHPVVVEWDDWKILAFNGDLHPTHFRLLPPPPESEVNP